MRQVRGHSAGHRKRPRVFRRTALRAGSPRRPNSHLLLRQRRQGHAHPAAYSAEGSRVMKDAPHVAPRDRVSAAIQAAARQGRPALVGFLTAGFPTRLGFKDNLAAVASVCDVVEIGVPFSDPMADGTTVQRASFAALTGGVTLPWILEELASLQERHRAPILLMSYLNPLLSVGLDALPRAAAAAGVAGFIVPDLPFEESDDLKRALDAHGLALVQMVTPVTPPERLAMLCRDAQGFVYAVTMTGTTGAFKGLSAGVPDDVLEDMD